MKTRVLVSTWENSGVSSRAYYSDDLPDCLGAQNAGILWMSCVWRILKERGLGSSCAKILEASKATPHFGGFLEVGWVDLGCHSIQKFARVFGGKVGFPRFWHRQGVNPTAFFFEPPIREVQDPTGKKLFLFFWVFREWFCDIFPR